MGFAKNQMMEEDEQGWSFTDAHVCTGCVDDYALAAAIVAAEEPDEACDFCGGVPAAPLDALLEAFVAGLFNEYEDALDGVGWDGREGGFQWSPTWDTSDLVGDFYDVLINEDLLEAVRNAVHERTWVERDFAARRRDEVLSESWDRFCEAVKYRTRYVFWRAPHDDDEDDQYAGEIPAAKILDEVGTLVTQLELLSVLPKGEQMWRAQGHGETKIALTAERLGTAPRQFAKRFNRMNPAGIPMFYGASDSATAVKEVALNSADKYATYGLFEITKACTVVDFTQLPPVPSMFDPESGRMRRQLLFLHRFVAQLSEPARPEYEQIDYVPTQVVTEYFLKVYRNGEDVIGMLYRSSITGEVCAVLDVSNEQCVEYSDPVTDDDPVKLRLVPGSVDTDRTDTN